MEVSHWPVSALRTPVSQAGVGLDVAVVSHWPVAELKIMPSGQEKVGSEVEVVSHWPVAELKVPVLQEGVGLEEVTEPDASHTVALLKVLPSLQVGTASE